MLVVGNVAAFSLLGGAVVAVLLSSLPARTEGEGVAGAIFSLVRLGGDLARRLTR